MKTSKTAKTTKSITFVVYGGDFTLPGKERVMRAKESSEHTKEGAVFRSIARRLGGRSTRERYVGHTASSATYEVDIYGANDQYLGSTYAVIPY